MSGHAQTVTFDVGGKHYKVSRSLIERFPDTILARMTSELWLGSDKAKDEPIFIERNGERFQYCLDYMRDGRVSVSTAASKDGIMKDLEYYGLEGVDPSAIEKATGRVLIDARRNMGEMVLDARKNLGEMQLRALCKKVAIDSVDTYLSSGKTDLTIDLTLRESVREDTWKNKGKDLIDETLAEFGFQTKSINYVIKGGFSDLYVKSKTPLVYELNVTIEGLKE